MPIAARDIARRLVARLGGRAAFDAPLDVPGQVCAVGDLHGRADLLDALLARLDAGDRAGAETVMVFLGDHVDRGPDPAGVVARLRALQRAAPDRVVALMGNHERMMLDFLAAPVQAGRRWLRFGGLQTLASYGVRGVTEGADPPALERAARDLRAAMPPGEADWLAALPLQWRRGNLICAHAALDPARGPAAQPGEVLLWGHRDFARHPRGDGLWVAHGHTVVPDPLAQAGRVALDTGAYFTDRLSAGLFEGAALDFLEA